MALHFEWDPQKAKSNLEKHGISFEDACTVFGDNYTLSIPDPKHSSIEERWVLLGQSYKNQLLVVVFTERCDSIRIIITRIASRKERKYYG